MNTNNIYKRYLKKCDKLELNPILKKQFTAIVWTIEDLRKTEKFTLDLMEDMCEESLSPEVFEKWEFVREQLKDTRQQLNFC